MGAGYPGANVSDLLTPPNFAWCRGPCCLTVIARHPLCLGPAGGGPAGSFPAHLCACMLSSQGSFSGAGLPLSCFCSSSVSDAQTSRHGALGHSTNQAPEHCSENPGCKGPHPTPCWPMGVAPSIFPRFRPFHVPVGSSQSQPCYLAHCHPPPASLGGSGLCVHGCVCFCMFLSAPTMCLAF